MNASPISATWVRCVAALWCALAITDVAVAQLLTPVPRKSLAATAQGQPVPGALAAVQVSGSPSTAVVSWALHPPTAIVTTLPVQPTARLAAAAKGTAANAAGPLVERRVGTATPVRLALSGAGASKAEDPGPLRPGVTVTYRVTVTDARGGSSSMEATFTPPQPQNPRNLSAVTSHDGSVTLSWDPVEHAVGYRVSGEAMVSPATVSHTTQWKSRPMPPREFVWFVETVYPGGVLTSAAQRSGVRNGAAALPVPALQFLHRPSGAGSHALAQRHYEAHCGNPFAAPEACNAADMIRAATNWEQVWIEERNASYPQVARASPNWPALTFYNTLDLGTIRRINCAPRRGDTTVCWTTTHNEYRGVPSRKDERDTKHLAVIVVKGQDTFFGHWEPGSDFDRKEENVFVGWGNSNLDPEHKLAQFGVATSGAVFDHQGRKGVPHACLSCHGGTFDPASGRVTGASLLPVVPSRLQFRNGEPGSRGLFPRDAAAEESMRRINQIVLDSALAPAIVDQINALYDGRVAQPGAQANDNAVPSGWSQQPGLYRQVIAPYCASCHFAQRGAVDLRSWGNALQHKAAIQRSVCKDFTMPHSEIAFRKFWTAGGIVSLPGLLSAALGYTKCPE